MIHLYGVVQELEELPPVPGLEGAPLERRQIEGLELVVSRTPHELAAVSEESVLAHATVVDQLMARSRAVLPVQFGRPFADEKELSEAVRTKAQELERGLSRVRGCVEFGLRVLGGEPAQGEASSGSSGRDYMLARLAETKERDALAKELHEPLARLSRGSVRFGGASSDLLQAAYLVAGASAATFRGHVSRLATSHPELTVVCTGPWPPYTFAGGEKT